MTHKTKGYSIVLAGNPNVGKSVLFGALTGMYQDVSNYPGTTVDIKSGIWQDNDLIDTPGVYGISSFNDEERVAKNVIKDSDIVINVVDSTQLCRDLFLTLNLIDLEKRVVVCLNMTDEAEKRGIIVDKNLLARLLGVEVLAISAQKKEGIDKLEEAVLRARKGVCDSEISKLLDKNLSVQEGLFRAEDDSGLREIIYSLRRKKANEMAEKTVKADLKNKSFADRISDFTISSKGGVITFLAVITIMFLFIGVFVSGKVVSFSEGVLFNKYFCPFVRETFDTFFKPGTVWWQVFIGKYGLLTMVPTYIFGLLLPLVVSFYLFLGIIEDSGYMTRIAYLADKFMTKLGLNGRAVIPFILGFGCVTVATLSTRVLGNEREKTIATALLTLAIPCSAQMGIMIGLASKLGVWYIVLYVLIIFSMFVLAGRILNKTIPGETTCFISSVPRLRVPDFKNITVKTYVKTKHFIKEAVPIFIIGALIMTYLDYSGLSMRIESMLKPLVTGFLMLPEEMAQVFLMAMIRRDFGAAGMSKIILTPSQMLTALVTMTLFVPCIASVLVILRERGVKEMFSIWVLSVFCAIAVGGITANLMCFLGV